jgi:hypothetical protein
MSTCGIVCVCLNLEWLAREFLDAIDPMTLHSHKDSDHGA